ncbi:hypothetical protein WN51_04149 [Melipona quadrifasciata]|uniref:Uncharacterized protein n=1 Tax=Melipona quadrifasciata TaxID=166423 RepID=A0A0M8ZSF0_9HYME|nr:hypothetical protein WN51_04149 [Melipona quadrifasciata]
MARSVKSKDEQWSGQKGSNSRRERIGRHTEEKDRGQGLKEDSDRNDEDDKEDNPDEDGQQGG